MSATNYGVFAPIVSIAGTIMAMGIALTLGWKGRAKWEPVEEDVPRAPQRVASLVAALMVVLIWARWNNIQYKDTLTQLVLGCLIALIASLIIYGLLRGFVYTAVRKKKGAPPNSKATEEIKVIGGLWLKTAARGRRKAFENPQQPGQPQLQSLTVEKMFALSDYHKDELWSRPSQQLASMLFTLAYLGLITAGTVALGGAAILTGVVITGDSGPVPIVLMGSSNVRSYVWESIPGVIRPMKPLWLDLGSGRAQEDLFFAFDYGALTGLGSKRTGLLALSSDGSLFELRQEFRETKSNNGNDNDQTVNNYWLSIKIANRPLAILYRGGPGAVIPEVEFSKKFPPEGISQSAENSYRFVRFGALRRFIASGSVGRTHRHLPESGTGTRAALDKASSIAIDWQGKDIGHPVSSVESLGDSTSDPFVLIISEAPWSSKRDNPTDCDQLKQLGVKTAVLCSDTTQCDHAVTVEFAIVVKIIPEHDALNSYGIGNEAECRIAEALTAGRVNDCKVQGLHADSDHIVELPAYKGSQGLPKYLACPD